MTTFPPPETVYLRPGDGRTFFRNGIIYELGADLIVLQNGQPQLEDVLTVLLVFYQGKDAYRMDVCGKWSQWGVGFVPSAAPPDWRPPKPPESVI